ncbi:Z1 domain-containing protein [Solibacillus sp. FSL H8-0538]|uniref:Z1 domain-containing protein n=1 Tax=Solibacillus sp. FSL H8-0538 TaxID=2921400 RepID=UPI0030FAE049
MKVNETYQGIYRAIVNVLQHKKGALESDEISNSIRKWRDNVEKFGWDFLNAFGIDDITPLDEKDWRALQEELESNFIVRIEKGILVQSKESRNRDLTWWSGKKKLVNENYYFNNYQTYMQNSLPKNVLDITDEDTAVVMNNLADPEGNPFSIKGMVVGHVQSGKTGNYAALICKAADAGYRFIVVIAGGQNNLRDQTQKRLQESFIGVNAKGVGSLAGFRPDKMPDCLTSETSDFKKEIAQGRQTTNFENMQLPILVVIKKHTKTLDRLLEWLDKYPNQIDKPMLVIDDESDYASINTKDENNPTVINKKIRLLLRKFTKSAYVAYTATPFANIFIDHAAKSEQFGDDLFPRDFIYALSPPDNYFGAQVIFNEEDSEDSEEIKSKYVVHVPNDEVILDLDFDKEEQSYEEALALNASFLIRHKSDYIVEELPPSLLEAVRVFVLNVGIRNLRGQFKHNSMLIHITRFTSIHMDIKSLVKEYHDNLKRALKTYGKLPIDMHRSKSILDIKDTFNKVLGDIEFSFEEVLLSVCDSIESIQVIDVHQKMKLPLQYRDDSQTNAIVIGGLSLARGFTLEGLSVSYFLRTTIYYDTLMQMGRWFGYRMGYQDLCRVYMTESMHRNFAHINNATKDLMKKLKVMEYEKRTPEEFGLAVQTHPDSILQVTARNKSKFTEEMYLSMDLKGQLKETRYISNKEKDITINEELAKKFIGNLYNNLEYERKTAGLVWREVNNELIEQFIRQYKFYAQDLLGLRTRFPIAFIREFINDYEGKWDIVINNGECEEIEIEDGIKIGVNRQKRTVDLVEGCFKTKKSQLARGNAESIMFDNDLKKEKPEKMRENLNNPLLFVHFLTLNVEDKITKKILTKDVIGLSFSFNNDGALNTDLVKVKINSVYIKQIEDAIKNVDFDEEYDEVYEDE